MVTIEECAAWFYVISNKVKWHKQNAQTHSLEDPVGIRMGGLALREVSRQHEYDDDNEHVINSFSNN
jgi:hypothetical protein